MKEIQTIIEAYNLIEKSHTQAALATVVRVEGSSYRRTGARMLVQDNGIWVGGISGGCLEGDALRRARAAITRSKSSLITYDTTKNDSRQIGIGLGCQGIIDVLFTPLDYSNSENPVEILKLSTINPFENRVLLTITKMEGIWEGLEAGRVIQYRNTQDLVIFKEEFIIQSILETISQNLEKGISSPLMLKSESDREISIFIEILKPDIHLIAWGHQYDVYPLILLCKDLGWKISQVAESFRIDERFKAHLYKIYEEEEFPIQDFPDHTAILLMAHDYKLDKMHLSKVLKTNISYIGMLGPKIRSEKMILELGQEGQSLSEYDLSRIYSPAGLDIGAMNPEEISLSILAEIRSVFSNRKGGYLKNRTRAIHDHEE